MSSTDQTINHNPDRRRFELFVDGKLSKVDYFMPDSQTFALTHTEVHPDLEGKGIGTSLVEQVLTYVQQHDQRIVPLCPFVASYVKRHPNWQRVVSTDYDVNDF